MRISLRWKLLVLLLGISLLPMGATTLILHRSMRRLGQDLGERTRATGEAVGRDVGQTLSASAGRELAQLVTHHTEQLLAERRILELAVQVQALEVERRLTRPGPAPSEPEPVYYDTAIDAGAATELPPDLAPSPRHFHGDDPGRPISVSYAHQVFRIAPGASPTDVAPLVARLASMSSVYRFFYDFAPDLILWQSTSFESGLHCSYPGHGGYPADFDPRKRPWFQTVRRQGTMAWLPPAVDATTGTVSISVAAPVRRANGPILGVTSIEMGLVALLERLKPSDAWSQEAQTMVLEPDPEAPDRRLVILAQRIYQGKNLRWQAPIKLQPLEADSPAELATITHEVMQGHQGVRQLKFRGREAMWAYGPVGSDPVYLLMIVPEDRIVAQAKQTQARVVDQASAAEQEVARRIDEQLQLGLLILLIVAEVVVLVALLGSSVITTPLRRLTTAVARIARGDLGAKVHIKTFDELEDLGQAFNDMAPKLRERLLLRESLDLAKQVQQALLPQAAPQVPGLDIAGRSLYCDQTGGDYFDFLLSDGAEEHRLAIAVGDVTGHGVAAALLMTSARAMLHSRIAQQRSLAQIVTGINRQLATDRVSGRFMTFFLLQLDIKRRTGTWVSAGHDPAIVYDPQSDTFAQLEGVDVPLGVERAWEYHEFTGGPWRPGQVIVIGTDGIWETRNPGGEMFGKERLRQVIRRDAGKSAEAICASVAAAVSGFRGAQPQGDDVTLVVVRIVA